MKDEIKEILSKMERLIVYGQYNAYYDLEKQLLDYITNLQEENERLKEELVKIPRAKMEYDLELQDYKSRCEKAIRKLSSSVNHFKTQRENNVITFTLRILKEGKK